MAGVATSTQGRASNRSARALARLFNDVGAAQVNIEDLVIEHSAGQRQGLATLLVAPAAAVGLRKALEQQGWKIVAN